MTASEYRDVAVVLITRNEEGAIGKVLADAAQYLPGARLYVVDDSDDRTPEIAREAGAVVTNGPRKGFGPAMHQALLTPEEPIIVTVDADDTYPPGVYPYLVEFVRNGYDIAGADRLGFGRPSTMPLSNYVANRAMSLLASIRARRRLRDVHSGQRAYRREVLHSVDWRYEREAFPIDLLMIPAMTGSKVIEVPIPYRERIGETTLDRWPSGKASLARLFRSRRDIRASIRPSTPSAGV